MEQIKPRKIVICGSGFAASLTALTLQNKLPHYFEIEWVPVGNRQNSDVFYGNVTAPEFYDFHLSIGVTEPELLLTTNTSFCFGSHYKNWAMSGKSWLQCFHLPFPTEKGVGLHQYVARNISLISTSSLNCDLQPYLINVQASLNERFAHPPEDKNHPMSRAEYGYQFSPEQWAEFYRSKIDPNRVKVHSDKLAEVKVDNGKVVELALANGDSVTGSLFIDCSGSKAQIINQLVTEFSRGRTLYACKSHTKSELGLPNRSVKSSILGWQSDTHLQGGIEHLAVFDASDNRDAYSGELGQKTQHSEIKLGGLQQSWLGNCLAIGQAAHVIEPITNAPMVLLMRDIKRLLELLPLSEDMTSEAKEYNRRFKLDTEHASLFHDALFALDELPQSSYWQQAAINPNSAKLKRKISQFEHRGNIALYDLEPFNEQDWTILHCGMGRQIENYDPLTEQIPAIEMQQKLNMMASTIKQIVAQMPPHALYMEKLKNYLEKNHDQG